MHLSVVEIHLVTFSTAALRHFLSNAPKFSIFLLITALSEFKVNPLKRCLPLAQICEV